LIQNVSQGMDGVKSGVMYNSFLKRFFDFVLVLMAMPLIVPLMLVLFVLIRLESKGSPLFVQKRVGLNEKEFNIFKLRSMTVREVGEEGSFRTAAGDKRITRIGGFLRKTSLDEVPQLFNVLLGHMSLIGPRPDLMAMKEDYKLEDWLKRCSVRPGVTGLAQVTNRSMGTPEERLESDLTYIRELSLSNDFKILFKTFNKVLRRAGVN